MSGLTQQQDSVTSIRIPSTTGTQCHYSYCSPVTGEANGIRLSADRDDHMIVIRCMTTTVSVIFQLKPLHISDTDRESVFIGISVIRQTRTAAHSCRTRKRAFHFSSPGVVRRSHAAARHVRALLYGPSVLLPLLLKRCCCCVGTSR